MARLSDFELGWFIGILEGEGYFGFENRTQVIRIEMKDEDTINKAAALIERLTDINCSIIDVPSRRDKWNPMYAVRIYGEAARIIMKLVVKQLSWRRRQQVWLSLNKCGSAVMKSRITALNIPELIANIKGEDQ